jgi:hypothetical protein
MTDPEDFVTPSKKASVPKVTEALETIEAWAIERGHINTIDHNSPPMLFDVSAQKAFVLAMVKVHSGHGTSRHPIGTLVSLARYDELVTEVMSIPFRETTANTEASQ